MMALSFGSHSSQRSKNTSTGLSDLEYAAWYRAKPAPADIGDRRDELKRSNLHASQYQGSAMITDRTLKDVDRRPIGF